MRVHAMMFRTLLLKYHPDKRTPAAALYRYGFQAIMQWRNSYPKLRASVV